MTHLVQVGAGSGGMTVLDIVCRDQRITHVTLIEPDIYKAHNVIRHQFPLAAVGQRKADLAADWLRERRPDLVVGLLACDLLDPVHADQIESAVLRSDFGICAADNESAKFHWDALMRRHRKPWTLGEVLSGGIGGFVHWFLPGGPCYGCVASFLRRSVTVDKSKPPDYSLPGGPAPETTIPASRASIEVVASLHAQITLQLLAHSLEYAPGFTSLLLTLEKVPGIFDEAFRTHRFRIPRSPECLICRDDNSRQNLDQALDEALAQPESAMTHALRSAGAPGLHVRYEKAGLLLDQLPIPWNADAVIIEANVRLPHSASHEKEHFRLHLSDGTPPAAAELLSQDTKENPLRVYFRVAVPVRSCRAEVFWRDHSLGNAELPMITAAEFIQGLSLQMPTLHVALPGCTVACQTFVNSQGHSYCASAVLSHTGPLAPVADLNLRVEVLRQDEVIAESPVYFTSGQLRARQALLTVVFPKLRRIGEHTVTWLLGARRLHSQRVRAVTKKGFMNSLRISATRFVVQKENGEISVVRWLPHRDGQLVLDDIARISPCFFISSSQPGMAGLATFRVQAVAEGKTPSPMQTEHEMLVTDGPMPLLPGTLEASQLSRVKHFTLTSSSAVLGVLPLLPAPSAQFTAEGGFAPLEEFLWSPAAEEQLNNRLEKLLGS